MKKTFPLVCTHLCLVLAGAAILFLINQDTLFVSVARVLGVLFIIAALAYFTMIALPRQHDDGDGSEPSRDLTAMVGAMPAVGGLCFGVVLLWHPELFEPALGVIFAILLTGLGLFNFASLVRAHKHGRVRPWHYIFPTAVVTLGVASLTVGAGQSSVLIILTGIGLMLSGVAGLLAMIVNRPRKKAQQAQASIAAPDGE